MQLLQKNKNLLLTILWVGLLVGTLDICCAFTSYYLKTHQNPLRVLLSISSVAFGKKAFSGGYSMMTIGLIFHYIIAYSFTILFFILYPGLNFFRKNRVLTGILYGCFIWAVMNLLVLPVTTGSPYSFVTKSFIIGLSILIAAIGIPLSYFAYRYYFGNKTITSRNVVAV